MSRELSDREVVDAFVAYRAATDLAGISVQSRPDESERNESAIDAIAGPLAVEHTSIDTIDGQRRDGARFMEVVAELESELSPALKHRLTIVFPYDGVRTGQDWPAMTRTLRNWILSEALSLPDGRHSERLPGFPFAVDVEKAGAASGRQPGLFFGRTAPPEPDLVSRLRTLIERKAMKLGPHRSSKTTALVIESDDIALMSPAKFIQAVVDRFPAGLPEQIDELWYADTTVPGLPPTFHRVELSSD